jgi:activator of 2-hydroxyglutaryl-CoA dehydratase
MRSNHSDLRGRRASGGEGERVIAGMVDSVLAEVAERLLRDAQVSQPSSLAQWL